MTRDHRLQAGIKAAAMLALGAVLLLVGWTPGVQAQDTGPPQDIVLMLDNSGSMRKNDPDFLTRVAVTTFLERLQGDVQIAIIMFDQNVRELMPLTQLNDATRQDFLNALSALDYRGLLTNSPAALEKSTYELRTKGRPGSHKSIIFMTDGIVDVGQDGFDAGDVEKARWMKTTLVDEAAKYNIRIYGIAYTDNADFELIQTLSSKTGGEYYRAATAAEIDTVFSSILGALSNQIQTPVTPAPAPAPASPAVETAAGGETAADSGALPETELPQAPQAESAQPPATSPEATLPESSLPEASLPEASLPEATLPEASLPEATLPESSLPEATQTEAPPDETADTTAPAQGAGEAPAGAGNEAGQSTPEPPPAPAAPAPQPQPAAPAPAQNLPVAMLAGASALLLALIALVLFLIKRKPSAAAGGTDPLMPKAFLNDIGNVTGQNSYELGAKPTIIGRLQGADPEAANYIVIDEATIGRRHSLIEYKDHSFWVADQNSLNGTFVNNKRIETSTRLKHGDRLRFHKHEFEFLILEMFETDRTMMSQTVFAERSADVDEEDDDATEIREPSGEDETIRRPDS